MSIASSIVLRAKDAPGPAQNFIGVVSVAVLVLCASKSETVNVLPISEREFANDPGRLLPFVIATLASFNVMFVVLPAASVSTSVELAPSSSVKK